jgi:hypothetical protein
MCHGCVSPVMSETVGPVDRRRGELEVPTGNRGDHPVAWSQTRGSDGASKRRRMAATLVATPADQSSKSGLRTRRDAAAWSTPASTSLHIQPKPLRGFESSSSLPITAKLLPPRKSHSSISSCRRPGLPMPVAMLQLVAGLPAPPASSGRRAARPSPVRARPRPRTVDALAAGAIVTISYETAKPPPRPDSPTAPLPARRPSGAPCRAQQTRAARSG